MKSNSHFVNKIIFFISIQQPQRAKKHRNLVVVSLLPASGRDEKRGWLLQATPVSNATDRVNAG
jgi:hypothetical protein